MRTRLATVALLTSFAFAACAKHKDAPDQGPARQVTQAKAATGGSATTEDANADGRLGGLTVADPQRKVIRTGRIDLVVKTYDDARAKLDSLLAAAGGYVDSTQVRHQQGDVSSATLVLRVPQEAFGQLVPKLKELGEVAAESTNAEDVSDQYVDVSARLASAKTLEKRLLEIAADRASGVEALLAVERELARVRGEIESYEGRLRQWNDQIAMSTLTLALTTKAPAIAAAADPGLGTRIKNGFSDSVAALETFATWLVVTGTTLLPWLILIVPGFVFGRRALRRYTRRLPAAIASPRAPSPE
ncbi:MAG TPA: DUF4349 domain-containing protein [Kofleriaceae bacterium]